MVFYFKLFMTDYGLKKVENKMVYFIDIMETVIHNE